jgi:ParB-like nuclease domain/DNA methylase
MSKGERLRTAAKQKTNSGAAEDRRYGMVRRDPAKLVPGKNNPRTHSDAQVDQIIAAIREWGFTNPILIDEANEIIAGHGRQAAAIKMGIASVPCIVLTGLSEAQKRALRISDNQIGLNSGWNDNLLTAEFHALAELKFDLKLTGFADLELAGFGVPGFDAPTPELRVSLKDQFGVMPMNVFDSRLAWWINRKKAWLALGIQSEVGRDGEHFNTKKWTAEKSSEGWLASKNSQASIFDPVLTELCYRWFSPPGGAILDPFAGGSVRGIVAAKLGRNYTGIELRPEQIAANREQAARILGKPGDGGAEWIEGDAVDIRKHVKVKADFLMSCPPYFDLEVYSEDTRDLSSMTWSDFLAKYRQIIIKSCYMLKEDRFACFVVGDIRDKAGHYRNLPGETIAAFNAAGLALYNDCILVTAAGSLPIRVRKQMETTRKLGATFQRVLVFLKGDARKAVEAIGACEFGDPSSFTDADETSEGEA